MQRPRANLPAAGSAGYIVECEACHSKMQLILGANFLGFEVVSGATTLESGDPDQHESWDGLLKKYGLGPYRNSNLAAGLTQA